MKKFLFLYKGFEQPTPEIGAALALTKTNPMITSVVVYELGSM